MRSITLVGLVAVVAVAGLSILGCWTSPPLLPGTNNNAASSNTFSAVDAASSYRPSSAKVVNDERAIGRVLGLQVVLWQNQDPNSAAPLFAGTTGINPGDPLSYPPAFPRYVIGGPYDYFDPTRQDPNNSSLIALSVSQDDPNEDNGNVYVAIRTASQFDPNLPGAGPLFRLIPPDPNRGPIDGVCLLVNITFEQKAGPHSWHYLPTLYNSADGGDRMAAMYALGWDQQTSFFYQMPFSVPFRLAPDPNLFSPTDPNLISYQVPDSAFRDTNAPYALRTLTGPGIGTCSMYWTNMTSPIPDANHNGLYPMFRNLNSTKDPNIAAGPGYANGDVYEIGAAFSVSKQMVPGP